MAAFQRERHQDRGELHGITVVVDTRQGDTWVGRCDIADERGVVLRDADVHRTDSPETSRQRFLERAAAVGVWPRHRHVMLAPGDVEAIARLAETAPGAAVSP